jgi:site-specific DNA recombinase
MNEAAEQKLKDYYSQDAGRRVSEGMREKAERGVMPGCAPLGYRNVTVNDERVVVPDTETAPKVRLLFELAEEEGMSLRKLAIEAERMGLRSRNGKPFGPSALKAILENPFYYGALTFQGKTLVGSHEPLVTAALFESVQRTLGGRRRNGVMPI